MDVSTVPSFWRTLCGFLDEVGGPCANPDSTPLPVSNTKEERSNRIDHAVSNFNSFDFPTIENPTRNAYVSVITLDVELISKLLGRPAKLVDRLTLLHRFIETARTLRINGVKDDIVLLSYGGEMALEMTESLIMEQLHVRFLFAKGIIGSPSRLIVGRHENFDLKVAEFHRAKIHILRLTQYHRLLYFDIRKPLSGHCNNLFDSVTGDFSVFHGDTRDGPFRGRAFFIKPSMQAYYDMFDIAVTKHFSVQKGWLEYGQIPAWGSASDPKTNWEFAQSSQDIGILYYYYFLSPLKGSGGLQTKIIDTIFWNTCVHSID
jgi:hypothetical protein